MPKALPAKPITQHLYQKYGDVIAPRKDIQPIRANLGTAQRFNHLAPLENLRGDKAKPNVCWFCCQPIKSFPFAVTLLERHPFSTQLFIPMKGEQRYLVVVCLGEGEPDLKTLQVFAVNNGAGITYRPGVWHHPILALTQPADFFCLVWENGTAQDCEVKTLTTPIWLNPTP